MAEEDTHEVRLVRLEERVGFLQKGHDELRGDVRQIKDALNEVLVRLGKVDVKQASAVGIVVMIVNVMAIFAQRVFG